jgi:hypothetical protein
MLKKLLLTAVVIFSLAIPGVAKATYCDLVDASGRPRSWECPPEVPPAAPASVQADKERIVSKIGPAFDLDLDFGLHAVNLTPHDESDLGSTPVKQLQLDNYNHGFRVTRFAMVEGGLGIANVWYFENATSGLKELLMAYVGAYPVAGKKYLDQYYVKTRDEIRSKRRHELPYKAEEVEKWAPGDAVSLETQGGVAFFAGVGIGPIINVGTMATATGKWKTYVEKVNENTAVVQFTDTDLKGLRVHLGNIVASVSVREFKSQADSFSYAFDLRSMRARQAYEDFIKGNILAIQKITSDGDAPDIYRVAKSHTAQVGIGRYFYFGIPILWNTEWGKAQIHEYTVQKNFYEGWNLDADYGVYLKDVNTREFFKHRNWVESFKGSSYHFAAATGERAESDGQMGEYLWSYADDTATGHMLGVAVRGIIRQTGFRDELKVKVPHHEQLQYASLQFKMTLGQDATTRFTKLPSYLDRQRFRAIGLKMFVDYVKTMKTVGDIDEVCADHGWDPVRCVEEAGRDTWHAMNDAYDALVAMQKAFGVDRKAYVRAYANFGRAMSKNQFTFRGILRIAGDGVRIHYQVEGERLSRYQRDFITKDGRLEAVNQSAVKTDVKRVAVR